MAKPRVSKGRKKKFKCVGGPYAGQKIPLHSSGTLEITVGDEKGYYDNSMCWRSTK